MKIWYMEHLLGCQKEVTMYSKINHQLPIMLPQIFHVRVIKDLLSKHSFHYQTQFNT